MRDLLRGSSRAGACGCRVSVRWNSVSSVGDTAGWFTASLRWTGLRLTLRPPGLRQVAGQRRGRWSFYPIPARDPLLGYVKQGDCVEARDQGAVECPHRRHKIRMITGLQKGLDHRVDGGIPGAHVVAGARIVGRSTSPIEILLVAGRQRLVPAVLDHVELVGQPAL